MGKTVIVVAGPTAIGKTALAIKLAQIFDTEIISADSRQFFKEMSIGTAVPNQEELKAARHHFIQHISIEQPYSVGKYERDALAKIDDVHRKHDYVIVVGGSGLYVKALLEGLDTFPEIDPAIRKNLKINLEHQGIEPLQQKLKELDPEHYNKIDIQNQQRVIRALEVCIGSARPYSSFLSNKKAHRPFSVIKIGLEAPREVLYDRINKRVDLMMSSGLLDEAHDLYPYRDNNALNTVGYKELFAYFDGILTLDEAVEKIKINTRRFAKRQLTWYRKEEGINWFSFQEDGNRIADFIKTETAT